MGRRDLYHARSEAGINLRVGDHRDGAIRERELHLGTDELAVAVVVGVHSHTGVTQHRLGRVVATERVQAPEGSWVIATAPLSAARCAAPHAASASGYRIVPEPSLALLGLGLLVGERGEAARAPVDDVFTPVDQPLLVQAHEHLTHSPAEPGIKRERGALPVAGGADRLELLEDGVARLAHEAPHALYERVAAQVVSGLSLLGQLALDNVSA